jgi:hypothetical protein
MSGSDELVGKQTSETGRNPQNPMSADTEHSHVISVTIEGWSMEFRLSLYHTTSLIVSQGNGL